MNVTHQKLPKSQIELTIEESAQNVAKFRKQVIDWVRKTANIKWFRKGSVIPEDIIVKQYGEQAILQMTIEQAIDAIFKETLKKEKLMPVGPAEIREVVSQDPLIVKIVVEVFPEVEVKAWYRDIKLTASQIEVGEGEIDAALSDIETRFTHFHDTDASHSAHMGDRVTIDTDGYTAESVLLESTSMRNYPLVLGSALLVPGFEEGIIGMKTGETRELDIEFPKDYHNADFAGKKTKFHVTIHKIEHAHKPEFTPSFIKELRGKELDIAWFRELIRSEILDTKQSNDQMERELKLIEELLKYTTLDIWDALLARQIDMVYEEIKQNVSQDGLKMSDYLDSLRLSEEQYKEKHVSSTALKRLQGELILNTLMEKEKTEVSDEVLAGEVEKILARFESGDVLTRLKTLYVPGNKYYEELRRRMAFRNLIDSFFTTK